MGRWVDNRLMDGQADGQLDRWKGGRRMHRRVDGFVVESMDV